MNRYRVVSAPPGWPENLPFRLGVPGSPEDYGVGDEFDKEFTIEEERENLSSGLLEIVPRKYRVIGDSEVFEVKATADDPMFMAALPIENEAALIQAGHIERVDSESKSKAKGKKKGVTDGD
jgi:hypothetical protein